MKAMILCAGKGTRLRPLTYATSKPMIPLVDKPVMQHIIEHLKVHGVDELAVNLSYMPDKIHDYFRDGSAFGVNMFYSYEGNFKEGIFEGTAIGSAGGLKKIQDETGFFDDTFVVLCGDAAVNLDLTALVKQHKERGALASIVLKEVDKSDVSKYGVVALTPEGRITKFQEKPEPEDAVSTTANTGIYIFEPEVLNHVPSSVEFDLGGDLFPILAEKGVEFYGAVDAFDWIDIGNIKDFRAATEHLLTNLPEGMSIPGEEVRPGVFVGPNVNADWDAINIEGPVYIGGGSKIADGARLIGPTVLGANCNVESHAIVHQSTLGDHVRVRRNTLLTRAIVFGGYMINEKGQSEKLKTGGAISDAREAETETTSAQEYAVADLGIIDRMVVSNWLSQDRLDKVAS